MNEPTDPRAAEIAHLRRLIADVVIGWRTYFAATGGKPEAIWSNFKALADEHDRHAKAP